MIICDFKDLFNCDYYVNPCFYTRTRKWIKLDFGQVFSVCCWLFVLQNWGNWIANLMYDLSLIFGQVFSLIFLFVYSCVVVLFTDSPVWLLWIHIDFLEFSLIRSLKTRFSRWSKNNFLIFSGYIALHLGELTVGLPRLPQEDWEETNW